MSSFNRDAEIFLGLRGPSKEYPIYEIYQEIKKRDENGYLLGNTNDSTEDMWISTSLVENETVKIERIPTGGFIVGMPTWFWTGARTGQ